MPSGSLQHRPCRSRRTTPWLLATLTLALALAGPANADPVGAEGISDPETVLAAEVPEPPVEAPPEAPEPAVEPAESPPAEPAPPAAEPRTLGAAEPAEQEPAPAAEAAEPDEQADPAEEVATEPPAYIADEPEPALPHENDADDYAAPLVIPLNLNVDIRILSPGDDGAVSQVIDMGELPGLGSGNPTDVLGGLGLGDLDLGLDWTWNWNWGCGDSSIAGLDWNWTWTWSGDCAAGLGDRPGDESIPPFSERFRSDRHAVLLGALHPEALGAPSDMDVERGPVVTPGAGGSTPAGRDEPDEALGAPGPSSGDGGFSTPAPTTFASTGATTRSKTATALAHRPAGSDPNGDPERQPAGLPPQTRGIASASGGGGGGGGAFSVLLLAALVGAMALVPPPPAGRIRAFQRTLSSLLSSSRLERPG
jgi:hypothetical protein